MDPVAVCWEKDVDSRLQVIASGRPRPLRPGAGPPSRPCSRVTWSLAPSHGCPRLGQPQEDAAESSGGIRRGAKELLGPGSPPGH